MNLSWNNIDQVPVSAGLTYFYRSYCPLLKLSFPDFSLSSFEIMTCNLVYEFVLNISSSLFPRFYRSYWPFAKIQFRVFSSADFWYWIEIWYLKIFWLNTDQVLLLSSLTFFFTGYCPLLILSFPDFSTQSFEILTLNRWSSSWSFFIGVMPPKYLLGPVGDMYCLSNTFRKLVQIGVFIIHKKRLTLRVAINFVDETRYCISINHLDARL